MAIETEVKFYTPDLAAMRDSLDRIGATLVKPRLFERNFRYADPDGAIITNGVVLRLRQDDRTRLTYKAPLANTTSNLASREELETEIGDFDTLHAILTRLGFGVNMIYEKYRTTYTYGEAEIVLDEMPFGNFIEIEGEAAAIEATISALGLQTAPRIIASYAELFEQVKAALGLTMQHLSFEAFGGIEVPAAVFLNIQ